MTPATAPSLTLLRLLLLLLLLLYKACCLPYMYVRYAAACCHNFLSAVI